MNSIDLTPLYRNSVGFDKLASLLDHARSSDPVTMGYPPYNIEILDENRYTITLAVAGFSEDELNITVEQGALKVKGKKEENNDREYLHQGIANRTFVRNFNLADYVEVTDAALNNGLLTISLIQRVPEAMQPKTIAIRQEEKVLEHKPGSAPTQLGDAA
ncbi:Hsp20 family protein [Endozoicomonadaceae bacterium StTr2]